MIINIRGTSGSGKSTIVREFFLKNEFYNFYDEEEPCVIDDTVKILRTLGIKYDNILGHINNNKIIIVGPYTKVTGGCDNISPVPAIFDRVLKYHNSGFHVIFEGLLVSRSKGRVIDLWNSLNKQGLHILHLTTPLEDCLKGIEARRAARGNLKSVNPARTEETFHRVNKISGDLAALGIPTEYVNREEAAQRLRELVSNEAT